MQQNIELHIEELVLHGFTGYNAYDISEAVQLEITRLLQERGLPTNLPVKANIEHLDAGNFSLQPGAKAKSVGNHIARSVYKGFTK